MPSFFKCVHANGEGIGGKLTETKIKMGQLLYIITIHIFMTKRMFLSIYSKGAFIWRNQEIVEIIRTQEEIIIMHTVKVLEGNFIHEVPKQKTNLLYEIPLWKQDRDSNKIR